MITKSINYANRQPGVPGWLTEDVGSGLTLTINGSGGVSVSSGPLTAADEVLGTDLGITPVTNPVSHTPAKFTIDGNDYYAQTREQFLWYTLGVIFPSNQDTWF